MVNFKQVIRSELKDRKEHPEKRHGCWTAGRLGILSQQRGGACRSAVCFWLKHDNASISSSSLEILLDILNLVE